MTNNVHKQFACILKTFIGKQTIVVDLLQQIIKCEGFIMSTHKSSNKNIYF